MNDQFNVPLISVVSPVYGASDLLEELVDQNIEALKQITDKFEIVLVDDACPNDSWAKIESLSKQYEYVVGIQLSRNFGQNSAIAAGLDHARGEWIVVMDCDLQDRPAEIVHLFHKSQEGYEIVFARRSKRKDPPVKTFLSKMYHHVMRILTGHSKDPAISNFGIYSRKAIDAIRSMNDQVRYFPIMAQWVGFNRTSIDVEHGKRKDGQSSYSLSKMANLALNNIIAYTDRPLKLIIYIGLLITIITSATIIGLAALIQIQYINNSLLLWLILVVLFTSGLILTALGTVGLYVVRIFDNVKGRPNYIIKKHLNSKS